MIRVSIASPQEIISPDRGRLRNIVRTVLEGEGIHEAEISLAFVVNPTIHRLNKQFLDHDEPTDVLTFPLSEGKKLIGEIVVGVEVAAAEAKQRGHDVHDELALYVIHGLLHLCGYDDHTDKECRAMRARESVHLRALGLPEISE